MVSAKTRASEVHFVTGSDEAAVRKAAVELATELAPDADVFGLEVIDGAADNVEAAINAPASQPGAAHAPVPRRFKIGLAEECLVPGWMSAPDARRASPARWKALRGS